MQRHNDRRRNSPEPGCLTEEPLHSRSLLACAFGVAYRLGRFVGVFLTRVRFADVALAAAFLPRSLASFRFESATPASVGCATSGVVLRDSSEEPLTTPDF